LSWLVPTCYRLVGERVDRRVLEVEVVFAWRCFLEEFSAAVAEEFVETDLNFEGVVSAFLVDSEIGVFDEWDLLVRSFCA